MGWRDIINSVSVAVDVRQPQGDLSAVWSSDGTYTIPASSAITIVAQASDPFLGAVAPVSGVDFLVTSGTVTAGLSTTSGQTTTITLTAGGADAVVVGVMVRAYSVPVASTVKVETSDSASIAKYGLRTLTDVPWAGVHDAAAIGALVLAQRKDRRPVVRITLDGGNLDTVITQQLARDLSDRVTIVETQSALNADFHIERIEHTVSDGGGRLVTTFSAEKAPAVATGLMVLGTGTLGTSVLGT